MLSKQILVSEAYTKHTQLYYCADCQCRTEEAQAAVEE